MNNSLKRGQFANAEGEGVRKKGELWFS